jgi:holo-[acyl-carrier-protein] synthase
MRQHPPFQTTFSQQGDHRMIYGIGTDIVSLKRIIRLSKKFGQAFAERILTPEELLEFPQAGKPVNYLAKRFAAKEAFAKAVGTGIRGAVSFRNIGIGHDALGKPEFFYAPALSKWLEEQGISRVSLSMSDEEDTVLAFVVAEK